LGTVLELVNVTPILCKEAEENALLQQHFRSDNLEGHYNQNICKKCSFWGKYLGNLACEEMTCKITFRFFAQCKIFN
jgi:hypothetical protein